MPIIFQWAGRNTKGEVLKGEFTANTREEVLTHLRKERITPTVVREKVQKSFKLPFGGGVKDKDIVIFSKQFSTMIDAGLPLVQALDILSSQTENKNLAKATAEIKVDVEGGSTYADALKKHPKIFSDLYSNMVAAGESGGTLEIGRAHV